MICPKCGSELNKDGSCPNCVPGNLREMRQDEISGYQGITIDEDASGQQSSGNGYYSWRIKGREMSGGGSRNVGSIRIFSTGSMLTKLMIAAAIALLIIGFLFVALPLAVLVAIVGIGAYLLYTLFT